MLQKLGRAIFLVLLGLPVQANAQTSLEIPIESFTRGLEIDGDRIAYSSIAIQTGKSTTLFGDAQKTIWVGTADEFVHTIELLHLSGFGRATIVTHSITFAQDITLDKIIGFSFDFPHGDNARIAYGPADNTTYQIEDTINIPAVPGYAKDGHMLYGGTPFNDVWTREGGIFVAVLASEPGAFSLPIEVDDDFIFLEYQYSPDAVLGAKTDFAAGDTLVLPPVMVGNHSGDFFTPLRSYVQALEVHSGKEYLDVELGNPTASQPYWKTWGLDNSLEGTFTASQVLQISETLAARGIWRIMLDYGWFVTEGIWDADDGPGFEDNDDLAALIHELERRGFETGLWYQPLQIDIDDETVRAELLEYAILDEDGDVFIDDDDLALMDPSNPAVLDLVREHMAQFEEIGVKHIYLDSQMAQLAAPPNHALENPLSSHRALPRLYDLIRAEGQGRGITIEICPDGRSQTLLNMPQAVTNIGDPSNDRQPRAEHRWLTAIQGSRAIIGTYVETFPDNGTSGSFLNIVGIGGNLQSIGNFDSLQNPEWDTWMRFNEAHNLVLADYLPLYDIAFDSPEVHVLRRGPRMYYSLFTQSEGISVCMHEECEDALVEQVEAAQPIEGSFDIELRGMQPNTLYHVASFPDDTINTKLHADENGVAFLQIKFTKELMLIATQQ